MVGGFILGYAMVRQGHIGAPGSLVILTLTTLDHLHYGSDYPFTPEFAVEIAKQRLDEAGLERGALRANSKRLFQRR